MFFPQPPGNGFTAFRENAYRSVLGSPRHRTPNRCLGGNAVDWTHGTNGLLIAFGISAFGVLLGLLLGRATLQRVLLFPLMAIPIFIVSLLLWTALSGPLER